MVRHLGNPPDYLDEIDEHARRESPVQMIAWLEGLVQVGFEVMEFKWHDTFVSPLRIVFSYRDVIWFIGGIAVAPETILHSCGACGTWPTAIKTLARSGNRVCPHGVRVVQYLVLGVATLGLVRSDIDAMLDETP